MTPCASTPLRVAVGRGRLYCPPPCPPVRETPAPKRAGPPPRPPAIVPVEAHEGRAPPRPARGAGRLCPGASPPPPRGRPPAAGPPSPPPLTPTARQPAHGVQHRLVDAVRREVAEAVEVRLVLELERPRHGAEQVHAVQVGKLVGPRDLRGGVARVHRAVAIRVLRDSS